MGNFFTTICMQTGKTATRKALRSTMKALGYKTDNKNAEVSFSIIPCGKKWCCLKIQDMDSEKFVADFVQHLNEPIFSAECVDSDFVLLTLYIDGETYSACIGKPYDEDPPVPRREFWQRIIDDFDGFADILSHDYVFAEEALIPLGKLLGFDGKILLSNDDLPEGSLTMGFSREGKKEPTLIITGPVCLSHAHRQKPQPYRLDAHSTIVLHNLGGPGKGIEIIIEASFSDRSDSPFEIYDVHLRDMAYQISDKMPQHMQADFKCTFQEGGHSTWHAAFPDFQIPAGFNPNYKFPSTKQQMDTEFAQCIAFNYRLRIPEHLSKLDIRFIPMLFPEGAYTWHLEDCWITPQELEIFYRDGSDAFHEYMRKKHLNQQNS